MSGGVIASAIQEGATPEFIEKTVERWKKVGNKYLPQISKWIQDANTVIKNNQRYTSNSQSLVSQIFTNASNISEYGGNYMIRRGVGFSGKTGGIQQSVSLYTQWQSVVLHSQNNRQQDVTARLTNNSLLTRGYYILSRVGEEIRGDGETRYQVVAHTDVAGIWTKAVQYNMSLLEFLNYGVNMSNGKDDYFDIGVSSTSRLAEKTKGKNIDTFPWPDWLLIEYNKFVYQVSRIVTLKGKSKVFEHAHDLPKASKTVNSGHLLEAFLSLGLHYKERPKGDKEAWNELKAQARLLQAKKTTEQQLLEVLKDFMDYQEASGENADYNRALFKVLEDPSPFWQGGEDNKGALKNIQVKGNGAGVTNLLSLVRQMTRIYAILMQLPAKVGAKVKKQTFDASLQFNDDEALEAIVQMFYRDSWHEVVNLNIL